MDAKGFANTLRRKLKEYGHDISQAQACELAAQAANIKDWNTLSAKAAAKVKKEAKAGAKGSGPYCPGCGKQGTLKVVSSAFVEQGPGSDRDYLYEGDADHLECSACGHQHLDWQSPWPAAQNLNAYVVLTQSFFGAWNAGLFRLGEVIAVIEARNLKLPEQSLTPQMGPLLEELGSLLRNCEHGHQELVCHLNAFGVEAETSANGESAAYAAAILLSELPDNIRELVVGTEMYV